MKFESLVTAAIFNLISFFMFMIALGLFISGEACIPQGKGKPCIPAVGAPARWLATSVACFSLLFAALMTTGAIYAAGREKPVHNKISIILTVALAALGVVCFKIAVWKA